jgi:hypothetical protein
MMNFSDAIKAATTRMVEQVSEDLFRDPDPESTEWWNAIWHVWRYQRKRRRAFLTLWMDDTLTNRRTFGCDGLATLYGGSSIKVPVTYTRTE